MHTLFIYLWLLAPGGEKKTPLELRLEKTQARLQEEAKRGKCPIEMHKIEDYLRQVGVSVQDIVIAVVMSSLMLCLVFTFLFVGMGAFMEGHVEAGQAAINSLITGGAAVGANLSSSGTADSDQKLRKILGKVIAEIFTGSFEDGVTAGLFFFPTLKLCLLRVTWAMKCFGLVVWVELTVGVRRYAKQTTLRKWWKWCVWVGE